MAGGEGEDAKCGVCGEADRNPSNQCRPCVRRHVAKYRRKNPERQKRDWHRYNLKRKFNLTPAQFEAMLEAQGRCCAICGSPKSSPHDKKGFAVDHCHTTGRIRGLLCIKCNLGIGSFEDDPKKLSAAIDYLSNAA